MIRCVLQSPYRLWSCRKKGIPKLDVVGSNPIARCTVEPNPHLKAVIFEVVEIQLKGNDPPQTRQTYERLLVSGLDDQEARRLIGCVVVSEIFDILKQHKPFDLQRFVAALDRLPKMPWDK